MKLNILHTLLTLPLSALLVACSDHELAVDEIHSNDGKTPIELCVGGVDAPAAATTRAVVTDGTGKTLNAFDVNSKIFMVMKSEYGQSDFGGSSADKYNIARGDVDISKNDNTNNWSIIDFNTKNQRYWDDAHARSSMLSIYAYAQKGQTWTKCTFNGTEKDTEDASQPWAWATTEIVPTILTWRATHQDGTEAQNQQSVLAQDLLFSNNLAQNDTDPSTDPTKDGRLKFNFTTRKFPQVGEANMIFYHAMSKITIKIIEGEGFDKTSANKANDFKFTTTGGNVILKQFNHTGTFDIKQGEFTSIAGTTDIPSIYLKTTNTSATGTEPHYVLEALAVPSIANNGASRFVDDRKSLSTDVMMEFAIDNNLYQLTHDDLYEALKGNANATMCTDNGDYIPLEAGKNYVFTLTVNKARIKNLTAQVADWEDVEANNVTPSNARIKLLLEERGEDKTTNVEFWKCNDNKTTDSIDDNYEVYNWKSGYTNLGATYSSDHWTTNYFWESNKDFYHFRALMPNGTGVTQDATNGDYVTLASGNTYTDVCWGAPMKDIGDNEVDNHETLKWKYGPTKNGFDADDAGNVSEALPSGTEHQIYKAIGPTEDPVKLILFHMMSDLTIKITTTTGANKVDLGDGSTNKTKVELVDYKTGGKLFLGNGLVQASDPATTASIAQRSFTAGSDDPLKAPLATYVYGAVPQDLTNVKLHITTPDNNLYIVDLKDVVAPWANTNNNFENPYSETEPGSGKYTINRWYPGMMYVYTFTLTKTGIDEMQSTIVEWNTIETTDQPVVIR